MIHNIEPTAMLTALAERTARMQRLELVQRALTTPPAPTQEEELSCPICLDTPGQFKTLSGCGHKVCLPCEENLKNTPHQHKLNDVLKKKFVKCPICRSFEKPLYEDLEKELVFWQDYSKAVVLRQPPRPTPAAPQRTAEQQQLRTQTIEQLVALATSQQPVEQVAAQINARIADYNRTVPAADQRTAQMGTLEQRTTQRILEQHRAEGGRPAPLRRVRCNGRRPGGCTRITQSRCHSCRAVQCCRECIVCITCTQRASRTVVID